MYISDNANHRVRKVTASTGVITTIAGTGNEGYSGDNSQATAANIKKPHGINLDSAGNVYFGDYQAYNVIRKVAVSTGVISTVAGTGSTSGSYNGDNIQATAATLNNPHDVVFDSYNNLYISDRYNYRIRKVTVSTGVITTVVGTGTASSTGDGSPATSATINGPGFIRFNSAGDLYIAEGSGFRVRKVVIVTTEIPTSTPSTKSPSCVPTSGTQVPTVVPSTSQPTYTPSVLPSAIPTAVPTIAPSTSTPSSSPSVSIVTTIAGTGTGSYSGDGGAATSAAINYPYGIVCDSSGNIYFAEYSNHRVRKVNPSTGIITTYVGTGSAGFSGDTGAATSATLYGPTAMAIDSSNNLYIAIDQSCRIRKVTVSTGIITTVAGNGANTYSGDGGQATSAGFSYPLGVAVNSDNNIFIPDNNHRIRKVTVSTGIITTIAGTGSKGYSGDGGAATAAAICLPGNINLDTAGNIYFGDHSGYNVVRKITVSTGVISTVAGTGSSTSCCSVSYNGDNIQATAATLSYPIDVVIDSAGNLYIGDAFNYRIRKVTVSTGIITTIAGTGSSGYSGDGGVATSASFMLGQYLRFDSTGSLYVTDTYSNRVRKIAFYTPTSAPSYVPSSDPTSALPTASPSYTPITAVPTSAMNIITTIAGSSTSAGYSGDNGQATAATLNYPHGLAVDTSGNVYIADRSNHRLRKVTISTGIITKLAGTGFESNSGDGGAATSAGLYMPTAVSLDSSGNIYIADTYNYVIRKITVATGIITRFAGGNGYSGGDGGAATSAGLDGPYGVIVDTTNDYVYIAAYTNHLVRKVVIATGIITTAAGSGSNSYSGDGGQATSAGVSQPYGVAVDSSGNIYATSGNRIRKVTVSTGIISTVAGTGTSSYSGDGGPATSASLQYPVRIAIDSSGNLYFADTNNHRIRKITLGGSFGPTPSPSMSPTATPTKAPSYTPTILPTAPTCVPTNTPTNRPSAPSGQPSSQPTRQPTTQPSRRPSSQPSSQPTVRPTMGPSSQPTSRPSASPTAQPTSQPSSRPSEQPTSRPSSKPSTMPSVEPSAQPSSQPTAQPSSQPTSEPSAEPSNQPSSRPSSQPSAQPSARPSVQPSR